jgi:hypothetical protein
MTRTEMDAIWTIDGLCYRIRDKWVSADTRRALAAYERCSRQRDANGIKRTARAVEQARSRDIAAALDQLRARKNAVEHETIQCPDCGKTGRPIHWCNPKGAVQP